MWLDPEQIAAAELPIGRSLVLAGPGSGKTRTLAARFARLVALGVPPHRILPVTFSRRAAKEMRARIAALLGGLPPEGLTVHTFHSLGFAILRDRSAAAGLPARPTVLAHDWQMRRLIEAAGHRVDDDEEEDGVVARIIRWKDALVTPEAACAQAASAGGATLAAAQAYAVYARALAEAGAIDLPDMVARALALLEGDPEARAAWGGRYDAVLVDEVQDVNLGQARLVEALLRPQSDLWAVGDEGQSLYGWRGADASFLRGIATSPGASTASLVRNHRSTGCIVAAGRALLPAASAQRATLPDGPPVVIMGAADDAAEAAWIAESVAALLARGVPAPSIAVLFRSGQMAAPLQQAFGARGIAHEVRGTGDFWSRPETRLVFDCACAAAGAEAPALPAWARERILPGIVGQSWAAAADAAARAIAARPPSAAGAARREAWAGNALAAGAFARATGSPAGLAAAAARAARPATGGVILSTVHAAKGCEFDAVFVAGAEQGAMPHARAEDPEEERRVCFVAATRARRWLSFSHAAVRAGRKRRPSPYLGDLVDGMPATALQIRGLAPRACRPGFEDGPREPFADDPLLARALAGRLDPVRAPYAGPQDGVAARVLALLATRPWRRTEASVALVIATFAPKAASVLKRVRTEEGRRLVVPGALFSLLRGGVLPAATEPEVRAAYADTATALRAAAEDEAAMSPEPSHLADWLDLMGIAAGAATGATPARRGGRGTISAGTA